MRWSAGLHYVGALDDHPSDTCLFPGDRGWAGRANVNVLGGVRNVTGILEDWVDSEGCALGDGRPYDDELDGPANEALKFLVHFLGDMHMPLHLTGRDRGGNGDKVTFDGRITSAFLLRLTSPLPDKPTE
jgi:S1/P1 Nuclease